MLNIIGVEEKVKLDHVSVWSECLEIIKQSIPPISYNTWFLPIKPIELKGTTLILQLQSTLVFDWVEEKYPNLLYKAITQILGPEGKLSYVIKEEFDDEYIAPPKKEAKFEPVIQVSPVEEEEFESNLNPLQTFTNFIQGEGNQLAYAAARAISDNPGGTSFNPFFIYGGVGLGKTHLMQAIGNSIMTTYPNKKVLYLSTDDFTNRFTESIRLHKITEFSLFFKNIDALIIDDIQFLEGKERTQDLFFQIFNKLQHSSKQIILSSDKPPKDLRGLNERMISRFQRGLTADIQPPDFETRIAILRRKVIDFGMEVNDRVIDYIANVVTSNVRELEGCLIKMLAIKSMHNTDISLDEVKRIVSEIATNRTVNITIEHITKTICAYLKVDENKLRDKTRKQEIVFARQLVMYFCKKFTKMSYKSIGLHFGGRDHTTVLYACNSIEAQLQTDQKLKTLCHELQHQIEINSL